MKIIGGVVANRQTFSDKSQSVFDIAIDHRRNVVILVGTDTLRGRRFKDDANILMRVESACSEIEFMACPGLWIDAALLDAARADWWYERDKDYGNESEAEVDDE